jgi:initiation factor 1A
MATHQKKHIQNTKNTPKSVVYAEKGEEYGEINRAVGGCRFEVISNGQIIIATLKGALVRGPKKKRVEKGQHVLIVREDSTQDKFWIIHVYNSDDVKRLRKAGELTQIKEVSDTATTPKTTVAFEDDFEDDVVIEESNVTVNDTYISDL